jgi:DNA adenine methylase
MQKKLITLTERDISTASGVVEHSNGFVKSPFGYFGSKQRLANHIAQILPPHNAWVEAFCGSAAVTMAKKPAAIEIVNDADSQIVNVFRQLRERPDDLLHLLQLTPYARQEFEESYKQTADDELEQARTFLVASMMTVNGAIGSNGTGAKHSGFSYSQAYARNGLEARVNRWNALPERLKKVVERLKNIRIEHRDARELFKMFLDRPATLVYLDPPYLMDREHGYKIDANDKKFHEELLEMCCRAKCMVLISGYDNPLYNSYLTKREGWKRVSIKTHTRDTKGKDLARTEILWKNPAFVKAVSTGRVPIRLSATEKANYKVNPRRGIRAERTSKEKSSD